MGRRRAYDAAREVEISADGLVDVNDESGEQGVQEDGEEDCWGSLEMV